MCRWQLNDVGQKSNVKMKRIYKNRGKQTGKHAF